jgi:hypothetical protein
MRCVVAFLLAGGAVAAPSVDLQRAQQHVPRSHLIGDGHIGMTKKLNAALKAMKDVKLKACDEFGVEELITLQTKLHESREPMLEALYRQHGDEGRRMGAFGVLTDDLTELKDLWAKELEVLKNRPELIDVSRDTKCHESIMWMVHHVPQTVQAELRKELTLPLLPERARHEVANSPVGVAGPSSGIGCDKAHASQSTAVNNKFVEWPEELTYTASAHGAFPFWDKGGPGCSTCDPSVNGTATLKVRYSSKFNAEILMHSSCGSMSWTGAADYPDKSPCNHIFTSDKGAFIYTPKSSLEPEADGKFCCRSVAAGSTQFTGAVPRDWMKTAKYKGTHHGFVGDSYSGSVEMFTWSGAAEFWYYTTKDGTPVQQGEGCSQPKGEKPTACEKMMPIVLYHDYDQSTFKNASFTSSDFTVPDVCLNTTVSCLIPGGDSTEEVIVV